VEGCADEGRAAIAMWLCPIFLVCLLFFCFHFEAALKMVVV
jgi:hypothetical protein